MVINNMLNIKSVSHTYGGNPIGFADWTIQRGEHWLLLGNSGSGKTTLMNIITGLMKPTSGEVFINDNPIYQLTGTKLDKFRGQHIGIVFQRPHLIKSLTVEENLLITQRFAGLVPDKVRVHDVLISLNIVDKIKNYPTQLSQGQLQRVAIARAVINKPILLVADEPTSSLDDRNTAAVLDILLRQSSLNESTLIISTHDKRVKDSIDKHYILDI
jgi:putative ABC transport system ATP-binding protein